MLSTVNILTDLSHNSDDDFRSGCRNVGKCHQQQSFSGLLSPGRSNHTNKKTCQSSVYGAKPIVSVVLVGNKVWVVK